MNLKTIERGMILISNITDYYEDSQGCLDLSAMNELKAIFEQEKRVKIKKRSVV